MLTCIINVAISSLFAVMHADPRIVSTRDVKQKTCDFVLFYLSGNF